MSCKCRKCREKLDEAETYYGKERKPASAYQHERRAADVYGQGSNGYTHMARHPQEERNRSGPVESPQKSKVVSAKPSSSISKKVEEDHRVCSNSAILETEDDGFVLKPGHVLKFNKGISGADNCGNIIISSSGDSITFKSPGMYRFVFTFAVEESAPNSIFISMSKSNPDHVNFQTLTVYTNGVNNCSTILPVKENTEVRFRHPGGKDKSEIRFVGPVRLELYEV